jgi:hypothetical protein
MSLTLEQRVANLEAIEAIKRLKATYAMYGDGKYSGEHAKLSPEETDRVARLQASCFTEDAIWDSGMWGTEKGREALFENFRSKPWRFAMHQFTNSIITVDGDSAKGTWMLWMIATVNSTGKCLHACGYTHDEYRCVKGEWLISKVRLEQKFLTPFTEPWSKPVGAASYQL